MVVLSAGRRCADALTLLDIKRLCCPHRSWSGGPGSLSRAGDGGGGGRFSSWCRLGRPARWCSWLVEAVWNSQSRRFLYEDGDGRRQTGNVDGPCQRHCRSPAQTCIGSVPQPVPGPGQKRGDCDLPLAQGALKLWSGGGRPARHAGGPLSAATPLLFFFVLRGEGERSIWSFTRKGLGSQTTTPTPPRHCDRQTVRWKTQQRAPHGRWQEHLPPTSQSP